MSQERPFRILNVDDDESKRYSVSRVLRKAGFDVSEANAGEEALRLARESRPDLIVLDIQLPDISGIDVCRRLKKDPATETIPILHLSATCVESADRVAGLNSGADGYLAEPVDASELLATVNALLRVRRAEEEARELLEREHALRAEAERQSEQLRTVNEELRIAIEELHAQHELMQRLNEAMDRQNHRSALLAEISRILTSSLEYETTLEQVARLLVPEIADCCTITVTDSLPSAEDSRPGIRLVAAVHADPAMEACHRVRLAELDCDDTLVSVPAAVAQEGKPQLVSVPGESDDRYLSALRGLGVRSLVCFPLLARGRAFGTLSFALAESGREYTEDNLALAEEAARRIATTMDNVRLYRELQSADARKDNFLAMLGHELRNPLGAVSNSLRILRAPDARENSRQHAMEVLERQVRHQIRLVDDLLDISRVTRGKILLRRVPLDLAPLVRNTAEDHRRAIEAAGLRLVLDLRDEPVPVTGDPTRLSQVLGNLLQNAEKFTDKGGCVTVRLAGDEERDEAVLSVTDTGIGIGEETLPHVFDIFSQSDRSLDRSRGGLGLGLSLVKELVALHGGSVRAHSKGLGYGATFSVTLPLRKGEAGRMKGEGGGAGEPVILHRSDRRRVLIVEDNRDAAETLQELLEMAGYEVRAAFSGPSGVDAAAEFAPEAVVCDLGLPGMDGFEVAQALRQQPATEGAKLIALSGYGQEEDRRRSREAGFDMHLVKPVDAEELQKILSG